MRKNLRESLISVAAVLVGFSALYVVGPYLTNAKPQLPEGFEDEDLAVSASRLKGFTLGFDGLIADWYWMRSLQYVGDKVLSSKQEISLDDLNSLNPRLLYPMLDSATTMDPQFIAAYTYGAVVLPAIDPRLAVKIAEKGIANNPSEWRLYQHLGYIYWKTSNYEKAAETYQKGSEIEGAPPFMRLMSARLREDGGSAATAMEMYLEICRSTEDRNIKEVTRARMVGLIPEDKRPFARLSADGCEITIDDKSPRRQR